MSNIFSAALWLALNIEVKTDDLFITLGDVHAACLHFFQSIPLPVPTPDVISKLIKRLFDVQSTTLRSKKFPQCHIGGTVIVFKKIGNRIPSSSTNVQLPPYCKVLETKPVFKFSCPLLVVIDGVQQTCTVGFEPSDLWIEVNGVKLSAGFPVQITDSNIAAIIQLILSMKLCSGARKDEGYVPKTFKEERISTTFETNERIVMRSKHCHFILEWLATHDICSPCNLSRIRKQNERKKRHIQEIDKNACLNKDMEKSEEKSKRRLKKSAKKSDKKCKRSRKKNSKEVGRKVRKKLEEKCE
ncbi:uncharacterized protein LOC125651852 [Ostrea edulis]|uniref:uncharacterized protein LOC125651852 n=1 Tax=Ostrea edulis TaxID=37623 RepID=UPI0024AFCC1E|nr:uncharacterized protein LOC125651852 [Ostrea edulis]